MQPVFSVQLVVFMHTYLYYSFVVSERDNPPPPLILTFILLPTPFPPRIMSPPLIGWLCYYYRTY